jgi:hypothetical protein
VDQVTNALAVIGVYFALMAVLSASVEAVISWLKVPLTNLQGKPSPEDVLNEITDWLPADQREAILLRIIALNKALVAIGKVGWQLQDNATVDKLVERIGRATTEYVRQDRRRRAYIRALAVGLGIGFAVLFQIDTLQVLTPLFPVDQLPWRGISCAFCTHVAGLLLSSVAASTGSSFWHDQSARLRQLKNAAEAVGELTAGRQGFP